MLNKLKPKSEFSKNVLTLMTGTTIAQAIPIAISPILTRIYTPEDFGKYAVFLSIILILAPIATLRYEQAIMLPKKSKSALALMHGSFYILLFMTILITLFLFLLNDYLLLDIILIIILPFAIFITGFININIAYMNRRKNYKKISKIMISTSFSNNTLNLIIGLIFPSYITLSTNIVISKLISIKYVLKSFLISIKIKLSPQSIYDNLKKYNDMLKFSTPEVLIGAINGQSIILFLTYFFDPVLAGGYFLIQRILGTPISVFSTSFSKVFFKEFTVSKTRKKLLINTWLKLLLFTFPLALLLHIYIYDIIILVFGANWEFSAEIAKLLLPLFVVNFIFSSTSTSHITLRLQHLSMIFSLVSFFAKMVIFTYGYYTHNFIATIKLIVVYDILQILLMNFLAFRKTKDS